jgi:hypothetical protein
VGENDNVAKKKSKDIKSGGNFARIFKNVLSGATIKLSKRT